MSTLPRALQPWWPVFKRVHRMLSLVAGLLARRVSPLLGERGVPRRATVESTVTAALEPGAVVLVPVGPGEVLARRVPPGQPEQHWRFVGAQVARVPATYALEVDGGRLVGDFGATVTPGGVLDYQTSGYFGLSSWREHPVYLQPTLGRQQHLAGDVLSLTTRGTATNYYHFLYDAIGRLGIAEEAFPGRVYDQVVIPHATRYQKQLIELAGIKAPLVQPERGLSISADRLVVPSTPNQDLDAPHAVVEWLRERLRPEAVPDGPRRLYLTRGSTPNTRRYVEEAALWPLLEERGFVRLDPGTLSVREQIDTFAGADVVVGPHGAALTNITFCRPGTSVIELFANSYVHLGLWTIADAVGLDYRYLVSDGRAPEGRPMVGVLDDVTLPPSRVLAVVDEVLARRTEGDH